MFYSLTEILIMKKLLATSFLVVGSIILGCNAAFSQVTEEASFSNTLSHSNFAQDTTLLAQYRSENEVLRQQYQDLEYLLSNRRWNEADKKTYEIVLKITGREDECRLFRILNNFWGEYYISRTGQARKWQYSGNNVILSKLMNCRLMELMDM